jgi:hypothetical protein
MSFDAWIVGFGISALLKELRIVDSNLAYLVLVGVGVLDALLLYYFFTVQLPDAKRLEALALQPKGGLEGPPLQSATTAYRPEGPHLRT